MSATRYPVRSEPNGYGIGVLKPKTDKVPTGVSTNCDIVLLEVGVTVKTPCLEVVPPNVATKLTTKRSKSSGATYTCVVSYWGATAIFATLPGGLCADKVTHRSCIARTALAMAEKILLMRIGNTFA